MLTELRKKSQVTIPKELVNRLGLKEGDKLEIVEKDGVIHLVPVAVYPVKYVEALKKEVESIKTKMQSGEQAVFESVEELFAQLDDDER